MLTHGLLDETGGGQVADGLGNPDHQPLHLTEDQSVPAKLYHTPNPLQAKFHLGITKVSDSYSVRIPRLRD